MLQGTTTVLTVVKKGYYKIEVIAHYENDKKGYELIAHSHNKELLLTKANKVVQDLLERKMK